MTYPLILDGKVEKRGLELSKITEEWLRKELKISFHVKPEEGFYAEIDTDKKLYVSKEKG